MALIRYLLIRMVQFSSVPVVNRYTGWIVQLASIKLCLAYSYSLTLLHVSESSYLPGLAFDFIKNTVSGARDEFKQKTKLLQACQVK